MRLSLPRLCVYSIAVLLGILFAIRADHATAASASHVVISEVQLAGSPGINTTQDEFVELYNPTPLDVNLANWKLAKKTAAGTETILATISGTIKSHGYFLLTAQPGYTGSVLGDQTYATASGSFAPGNTVLIYNDSSSLVDKVGFTNATDFETSPEPNPGPGESRERSANNTSTKARMAVGGIDEFMGNGEDTDNNSADFVGRDVPQPQNSSSAIEPVATATPTLTPTVTPTVTPTMTPTETPIPSPSQTPTNIPSLTPAPTITVAPTVTTSPTPSATVSPTLTLTVTPTPAPFPNFRFDCTTKTLAFKILTITINVPLVSCKIVNG